MYLVEFKPYNAEKSNFIPFANYYTIVRFSC